MNLAEGLLKEMNRCMELLKYHEAIRTAEIFRETILKRDIKLAEKRIVSGDVIGMMKSYEVLKNVKE